MTTPERARLTLRDVDNRADDGAPYEVTGTADEICGYIDGPLRRDLRDNHDEQLNTAMAAVHTGDLEAANTILRPLAVTVNRVRR